MTDLVATLGRDNVQRLADVAGGTRLSIPLHLGKPPNGGRNGFARLSALVGAELATLLIFHFADSALYVPRLERSGPVDPKAVARLAKRHNVPEIARRLRCSERAVFKHLARTRTGSLRKTSRTKGKDRTA